MVLGEATGLRPPWQEFKLFRESCNTKRFLEECRFGRDGLIHAAFRVPGHIDDVNVGMKALDLASKRRAAKLGHDDVGEEDADGAGMMAGGFESVQGTLRFGPDGRPSAGIPLQLSAARLRYRRKELRARMGRRARPAVVAAVLAAWVRARVA
jgi:hypothetical protein